MNLGRSKKFIAIFLIINIFIANFIVSFAEGEGLPNNDLENKTKTNTENKTNNTENTNTKLPPQTQEEKTEYEELMVESYYKLVKLGIIEELKNYKTDVVALSNNVSAKSHRDGMKYDSAGILAELKKPVLRGNFAKYISLIMADETALQIYDNQINVEDLGITDLKNNNPLRRYIAFMIANKYMSGYADGKFKLSDRMKTMEAIAVMVRLLGYQDAYLEGSWPHNYIARALRDGVLNGIDLRYQETLDFGTYCILLSNLLEARTIKSKNEFGFIEEGNEIFREKYFKIYEIEEFKIKEKYEYDNYVELTLVFEEDNDKSKARSYSKGDERTFLLKEGYIPNIKMGLKASAYVDEYDRILYIMYDSRQKNLDENAYIEESYNSYPKGYIKISNKEDYIKISSRSEIYLNGEIVEERKFDDILDDYVFGNFVVEDDVLVYASLVSWEEKDFYIEEIDKENKILKCIETSEGSRTEVQIDEDIRDFYMVEGNTTKKITFESLQVGDIINITDERYDTETKDLYAWRKVHKGRLKKILGGNNGQQIRFTLDNSQDTEYKVEDKFGYTYNNNKNIYDASSESSDVATVLQDFYKENLSLYSNWRDKITYVSGNFNLSIDLYGVLVDYVSDSSGRVKIYDSNKSRKNYDFDDIADYDYLKTIADEDDIIKYTIKKNRKLKRIEIDDIIDVSEEDKKLSTIKEGDDFGVSTIEIDGEEYEMNNNTVFYDYSSKNPNTVKKLSLKNFKEKDVLSDVKVIFRTDDDDSSMLTLLVVRENMAGIREDTVTAYVKDSYRLGDKKYAQFIEYEKDTYAESRIDDAWDDYYIDGRVVLYEEGTDGYFNLALNEKDFEFVAGEVTDKSSKKLTIDDDQEFRIDKKESFLIEREMVTDLSDLDEDDIVVGYVSGSEVRMLKKLNEKGDKRRRGIIRDIDLEDRTIEVEIDSEDETFRVSDNIDFIFKDDYLKLKSNKKLLIEEFADKDIIDKPAIIIYDDKSKKIKNIIVYDNLH
ncbi:hypothetical protein WG909_07735 [Peptostreptococcaceae bacterium AGR-M142]